jgi:hypothetical protein
MARITQQSSIRTSGVSYENEPIIKSDGSGEIMQWQPSDGGADGIYITEGGSAGDPARLGIGLQPASLLHIAGDTNNNGGELILQVANNNTTDNIGTIRFGNNISSNLSMIQSSTSVNNTTSDLSFHTSATGSQAPRLTIDSSGRVHVGTGTASQVNLNVTGTTGNGGIMQNALTSGHITSGTNLGSYGFKGTDSTNTNGAAEAKITAVAAATHSGISAPTDLVFYTKPASAGPGNSPTERMRIASTGNVTQAGGEFVLQDGSGADVGKISTLGGNNITISGSQADHCGMSFATNAILPCTVSVVNNNTVDLGASGNAYKDLYLAGTATIGGSVTVGSLDIGHGAGTGGTADTGSTAVGLNALDGSLHTSTNNTAIGANTLTATMTAAGDRNTAVGGSACAAVTSGDNNTGVGYQALLATDDGYANTAIGTYSLKANCANNNTAVGLSALTAFTGSDATAVGAGAADAATSAAFLTAVGSGAGGALVDQPHNTFVGYASGNVTTGESNTFVGSNSGLYTDDVDHCIAIGRNALLGVDGGTTDGDYNIAIGNYALEDTTTGYSNVAIGYAAGRDINAGYHNVAVGFNAAVNFETGDQNIAIGSYALNAEDAANSCVAVGFQALQGQNGNVQNIGVGFQSLFSNKSGTGNTALGYSAGYANVDGYNTWVGHDSGRNTGHAAANTTLGYHTYKSSSFPDGTCDLNGTTTITCDSSADIAVGQSVTGSGIPYGAYVATVNSAGSVTSFTISEAATTTANNQTLTFFTGTGDSNTCVGYKAGEDITSGHSNVLIGREAGEEFTNNDGNVVVGAYALDAANGGENYNVAVGYAALSSETSGADYCVAVGYDALGAQNGNVKNTAVGGLAGDAIVGGSENTLLGYLAGSTISGGNSNTAIGHTAYYQGTGTANTVIGGDACRGAMDGSNNTVVGHSAGTALTDGPGNVLIGKSAGAAITTGDYNIAIGFQAADELAGDSDHNIAIGATALGAEDLGSHNIAIGGNALAVQNTHTSVNLAVGYKAGYAVSSGSVNVLIGHEAGSTLTNQSYNTAVGYNALKLAASGANTAVGYNTLSAVSGGENNTAIGHNALGTANGDEDQNTAIGHTALYALDNDAADNNVALGHQAGRFHETTASATPGSASADGNNTGSANSIYIGQDTRASSVAASNEVVIGYTAVSNGDNTVTLGNDDTGAIHCADTSIAALSDRRIKRDIKDTNVGLSFVEKLNAIEYKKLNPADWPEEIRSHRYRVEEQQELVTPAVEAAEAVYDDVVVVEAREAVEEVTETIEHPAQEEAWEDVVIPAIEELKEERVTQFAREEETEERVVQEAREEIKGERQKHIETEVTETVTREEIVQIDGKWVKREVSEEVTRTERTPVYEECDLYNEDGTQCMCCVTEAVEAKDAVVDEDGNEIEPAVEAVAEVTEPMKHKVPVMEEYVVQAAQEEKRETVVVREAREEVREMVVVREAEPERTELQLVSPAIPARTEVRVITPAEPAVEEVKERRLVSPAVEAQEAVYKTITVPSDDRPDDDDTVRLGLVAQDVQTAMSDAGVEFDLVTTGANGKLAVKYSNLVIPLLKAVQELSAEVKALKG